MESKPVTAKYTDLSTPNWFRFAFHCDRCGAGTLSERYVFNPEDFDRQPGRKEKELLWTQQHEDAFERANSEAKFEFNVCPSCGGRFCNECFRLTEESGLCVDCGSGGR